MYIKKELAQQIVDSVKTIVEKDINFIDKNGIIIASTNQCRIGNFHQAGYDVVKNINDGTVKSDTQYVGSKKGVNYPIYIDKNVVGVIGITGDPEQVSKYGFVITKISEVFIKDYIIELRNSDNDKKKSRLISAILYKNIDEAKVLIDELNIDVHQKYVVAQVKINDRCNPKNVKILEMDIINDFEKYGDVIYSYVYPNEIIIFVTDDVCKKYCSKLDYYKSKYDSVVTVGIGTVDDIYAMDKSYRLAKIANQNNIDTNQVITCIDDMNLSLLLKTVDMDIKNKYVECIIKELDDEDISIIKAYFACNMSLKQAAESMFMHKNTLQYKLNKIKDKTGLDPRLFLGAVELFVAVQMVDGD